MISTKHQYRSHTTILLLPFLICDAVHIAGNRNSGFMSYNLGTVINFEAVGSNVQGQELCPQQIYLKPMIFLHHTEIYFKSTPMSTLRCNSVLRTSRSVRYAPNKSS